jgi:hypothetical protein
MPVKYLPISKALSWLTFLNLYNSLPDKTIVSPGNWSAGIISPAIEKGLTEVKAVIFADGIISAHRD